MVNVWKKKKKNHSQNKGEHIVKGEKKLGLSSICYWFDFQMWTEPKAFGGTYNLSQTEFIIDIIVYNVYNKIILTLFDCIPIAFRDCFHFHEMTWMQNRNLPERWEDKHVFEHSLNMTGKIRAAWPGVTCCSPAADHTAHTHFTKVQQTHITAIKYPLVSSSL